MLVRLHDPKNPHPGKEIDTNTFSLLVTDPGSQILFEIAQTGLFSKLRRFEKVNLTFFHIVLAITIYELIPGLLI